MSKGIEENKKKVAIKRFVWYFNLYWKFMCTVKIHDKNKMNLPLPSFHSFLNCSKTAKSTKTLKFSDFQFVLWKIKSNCMSGLFYIANLLEVGWKKFFFLILWILIPFKPKWSKIFHNKCYNKSVPIKLTLKLAKNLPRKNMVPFL